MYKVSIIIPTYNRENLITKALDSLINQSYQNIEIIVIDDGSSDHTREALKPYQELTNFSCYYQNNQGRSVARNKGIEKATGEFLMFLDSDDYLEPHAIASLVLLTDKYPETNIFAASYRLIEEKNGISYEVYRRDYEVENENILLLQINIMVLNIGNNMIRKNLISQAGKFTPGLEYAEDWELLMKICLYEKAVVTKNIILNVFRHSDNSSFIEIQEAIITVANQFLNKIDRGEVNYDVKMLNKMQEGLNKRIAMAYNRKGEKRKSAKYFIRVIKQNPIAIGEIKFIKELLYLCFPTNQLLYFRKLQMKLFSKSLKK